MQIVRGIGAVLAGFVVATLVVLLSQLVLMPLLPGDGSGAAPPAPTPAYLVGNLAFGFLAALVGGHVAATIGSAQPLGHALGLGGLFVVGAVLTGQQPGQPDWYPVVMPTLAVAGAALGGWIRARRHP